MDLNPSLHYFAYYHLYQKMTHPTKKQSETKSIKKNYTVLLALGNESIQMRCCLKVSQ